MPKKRINTRGRRAAPNAGSVAGPTDFSMGGKAPEVVPKDSYDIRVLGCRPLYYKSGSVGTELSIETDDGVLIDLDSLLVESPGGTSALILRNRGMLRGLADLGDDDEVTFKDVLERLNRGDVRAEVTLTVGAGLGGRTVNKLDSVDAIIEE